MLGLLAVLADLYDRIVISSGSIFKVVYGETYGLRLSGRVGLWEIVRVREIKLRQALRFGQKLPAMHLSAYGCVENRGQGEYSYDSYG